MPYFEIRKIDVDEGDIFENRWEKRYEWVLRQGSEKNPGSCIAESVGNFDTEKDARSDIANAKKIMGGSKMAKVVVA